MVKVEVLAAVLEKYQEIQVERVHQAKVMLEVLQQITLLAVVVAQVLLA
jgi:hypothetical protein